jgi:hypothetical protein
MLNLGFEHGEAGCCGVAVVGCRPLDLVGSRQHGWLVCFGMCYFFELPFRSSLNFL